MPTASNEVTSIKVLFAVIANALNKKENLVAAGTLYATTTKAQIDHVKNMTANWIEMAKVLQDENVLIQISNENVASNDMYYHKSSIKCCYQKYKKRYIKKLKEKDDDEKISVESWFKFIHWTKLFIM